MINEKILSIINGCGGEQSVAYNLNVHQQTVRRWLKGGIPSKYWLKLVSLHQGKLTYQQLEKLHKSVEAAE